MERFWVVGGEYVDMEFRALKSSAPQVLGPFDSRDAAAKAWRRVSDETRACATARFSIASERLVMPA